MAENRAESNAANDTKEQALVITRLFDAPRDFVWKVWTDPSLTPDSFHVNEYRFATHPREDS